MVSGDLLILVGIGVSAGVAVFLYGFKLFNLKRLIENTPTSKVRSVAMGLAEVKGKTVPFPHKESPEGVVVSPMTNVKCVWMRLKVEERRRTRKSSYWATVLDRKMFSPFYVKDDTGEVLINPLGGDVNVPIHKQQYGGLFGKTPVALEEYLGGQGIRTKGWIFNKSMRFTEWVILPGTNLYVLGNAGDNPFVEEGSVAEGYRDVQIAKGKGVPFYISDKSEKDLIGSFAVWMWVSIVGGPILALGSVYFLIGALV